MERVLRIATRGSRLALVQSYIIGELISQKGIKYKMIPVKSEGDRDLSKPLYEYSERGVFVKAINEEILNGNADIAVHSAKDLPFDLGDELEISYYSERGDTRDYFVSNNSIIEFQGTVGGSSIRRKNFLSIEYKSMNFKNLRGNIDTRIAKWKNREVDGLVLAKVAIDRLGLRLPGEIVSESILPPAPNQGLIAVVTRKNSDESRFLENIRNRESFWEGDTERKLMGALSIGCDMAVSIRAYYENRMIKFSFVRENKRFDLSFKNFPESKEVKQMRDIIYE